MPGMTDAKFTPPVPTTPSDCQFEVLRRTMAGLEYAILNPEAAPKVMADLHDELVRAYVEGDGGKAMLEALYSATNTDQDLFPHGRELTYLASPYSAEGETKLRLEKERFEQVSVVASELFRRGTHVFSPIAHSHPIKEIGGMLPGSFSFWETYCRRTLLMCDTLTICQLDGWQDSVGVKAETELAKKFGKPIRKLDPAPILAKWKADHLYTETGEDRWHVTTYRRKA